MTLVEKADALALRAHQGQVRKEVPIPYITHPRAVAEILKKYDFSDVVIAAALVHDVVEDTPVTLNDIRHELGGEVARLVAPVTHDDSLSWEEKKKQYIEAVRAAPDEAKAIAAADKIHNAQSFIAGYEQQGLDMWRHFNRGRDKKLWFEESMLKMLQETWQHPLVDEYASLVTRLRLLA